MKLYHYGFKKEILEEGLLGYYKHNDTEEINELIYEQYGELFKRDYCVFFNLKQIDDGELTVSVDSKSLNEDLLFVANQEAANDIYRCIYNGEDYKDSITEYVESIMKLKDYNNEYENPEVFYGDDIPSDLLTLEYIYEG